MMPAVETGGRGASRGLHRRPGPEPLLNRWSRMRSMPRRMSGMGLFNPPLPGAGRRPAPGAAPRPLSPKTVARRGRQARGRAGRGRNPRRPAPPDRSFRPPWSGGKRAHSPSRRRQRRRHPGYDRQAHPLGAPRAAHPATSEIEGRVRAGRSGPQAPSSAPSFAPPGLHRLGPADSIPRTVAGLCLSR